MIDRMRPVTHLDNDKDHVQRYHEYNAPLKPVLAILQIESRLRNLTQEFWLASKFVAHRRSERRRRG